MLTRHDGELINESNTRGWLDEIYTGEWARHWEDAVTQSRDSFAETLTFPLPFEDTIALTQDFDRQFEGIEAILETDLPDYLRDLQAPETTAAGKLLASRYLIPLPERLAYATTYHKGAGVLTINGDYDPVYGLRSVAGDHRSKYNLGEIL